MPFHWVAPDADASAIAETGLDQRFPTQADAEGWLSASYEELADAGIVAVTLMQDDHVVYGPMSLLPE